VLHTVDVGALSLRSYRDVAPDATLDEVERCAASLQGAREDDFFEATRGLDALVFTGGVGENSATVRALAVDGLRFFELAVDGDRNDAARPDTNIAAADSGAPVLVVEAREDLEMARQVRQLLDGAGP
jgi:acetate kinase